MGVLHAPGAFLGDEIMQSDDPAKHADDLVATMAREKLPWAAQQINDPPPGADWKCTGLDALGLLQQAGARRGYGAFGPWAQRLDPTVFISRVRSSRPAFAVVNCENGPEEIAWQDAQLSELAGLVPAGVSVIATQAAFDWPTPGNATTDAARARAKRWWSRGYDLLIEADLPHNPNATIANMLLCAAQLEWPAAKVGVTVYLVKNTPAGVYTPEIGLTQGRWSVFRWGDLDTTDFTTLAAWPRPTVAPPPPPPPPPLPTATIPEFHDVVLDYHQRVLNKGTTLGPGAYPTLEARLSRAYKAGVNLTAAQRAEIVALFDRFGVPQP